MKFSNTLFTVASLALANALPQASTLSPSPSPSASPSPSSTAAAASFATTSGLDFVIDGETGYFPGSNSYWIGFLTNDADVDTVFDHMAESGLRILRVWGFNDVNTVPGEGTVYYQLHQDGKSTINTGADGLQRLDYVVQSAEERGIKLIINFVNYWDDYGGMNAYVQAYGGSDNSDFYASEEMQTAYKAYIQAVVERYVDSPAVFAWELANEPRCQGCETSVLHEWIESTSSYIKGLDSEHLVCIGDEGFGLETGSDGSYPFGYSEGSDFAKALTIDTIDFGTFHLYPDSWGTNNDWGNLWVTSHGAACEAAGKPCLFEEYGVTSNHCAVEKPWQTTALNTTGVSGDLYWQYGDTLSTGQSPDDGNTFYYGTEEFECLVTEHVEAIKASGRG
ncbi:glycoside hydrolase 5 family protein [Aspergillus puulaauensis]|uniref:mannan endo-1,4-beta-mannosidase n=1 Tax=Aspergillus puulaauensis TaxID=1220207 RepID=A0A7R7XKZ1_9EURO|nr:mannan endo-1,4-beta-mannosidase A-1 [Aspergillus puulaauensis]BCS23179.1 mannan endo-1,4-beta-mannosidase A-1 [Aspergillus puulaauensis]